MPNSGIASGRSSVVRDVCAERNCPSAESEASTIEIKMVAERGSEEASDAGAFEGARDRLLQMAEEIRKNKGELAG